MVIEIDTKCRLLSFELEDGRRYAFTKRSLLAALATGMILVACFTHPIGVHVCKSIGEAIEIVGNW